MIVRKLAAITDTGHKGFWARLFGNKKEENTQIPRKKEEPEQEIKASNLENKTDNEFSKISEEDADNLETLKKYTSEPKDDSTRVTPTLSKKEEKVIKNKPLSKTNENNIKNYDKTDKKEDSKSELRKSYVSNTNYDWTSDASLKKEAVKSESKLEDKRQTEASFKSDKSDKSKKESKPQTNSEKKEQVNNKNNFKTLLNRAKSTRKKEELTELYQDIHEMYDAGSVEFQAKYYKDIMDLYTKLSKMN